VIHNPPGLILVSKDGRQNFIVGSKFLVEVPYRKTVTLNGMVAYCMDFHREPPDEGSAGYDVLGLAGEQADPAMQALQRLMDVIAEREPGPLLETPGANGAIWRITDDRPAFDPDSRALLEAAGVDPDTEQLTFAAPHFDDPLPDGPTSALGAGGTVLPAPTAPVEGALPVARPPRLTRLRARSVIHLARPLIIGATATLTGSRDALSLSLERGRRRVAASPPQDSEPGRVRLGLALRHARPGRYRLVVHGRRAGTRTTKLVLRR
jgi:hypothetical protein